MSESVKILIVVILMILTVFVYASYGLFIASPFIAVTVIFFLINFTKVGALSASKRINRFTYNAIKDEGIKRIKRGTFHVSEDSFSTTVEKIKDVLSEQQYVPEFGLDGMFISYSTESDANSALERIRNRGVKADTVLDRRTWLVKIEFD